MRCLSRVLKAQYQACGTIVKAVKSYEMRPGLMKQVTRRGPYNVILATVSGLNSLPMVCHHMDKSLGSFSQYYMRNFSHCHTLPLMKDRNASGTMRQKILSSPCIC